MSYGTGVRMQLSVESEEPEKELVHYAIRQCLVCSSQSGGDKKIQTQDSIPT